MKTLLQQRIEIEFHHLAVGETTRAQCPNCLNREASFAVTRNTEGLLYRCHRSTCDISGFTATRAAYMQDVPTGTPLKPYSGELLPLTSKDKLFFKTHYELSNEVIETIYANEHDEYVLEILGPSKYVKGYNVRQPWPNSPRKGRPDKPKARVWMHSILPVQSFHSTNYMTTEFGNDTVVVVEDQLSAMKVAVAGLDTVAIIGTHMNEAKIREIAQWRPKRVLIALDADATAKSFIMARKWGLAFEYVRVVPLERDLKDSPLADIPYILGVRT